MKFLNLIILFAAIIFQTSCDNKRVYETNIDFKENKWFEDTLCTYSFEIEDISIPYNVMYIVRNSLNYQFYNLYVTYYLFDISKKQISSELHEMQLMDSKTGAPFGSGMGEIFTNRVFALQKIKFPKKGKYTFKVKQYMRKSPLEEILSFGIRVEKAE
ncbi:MAG: gliding motility lipoprotein GldH [Cytophagales bacterium]|nr:MAG: gliding motility lipoprotein GldH [Cytophagales bacterium]TAG56155.1 MAG: gliding motility lipoprotein GldH [Cytophagales bacterium]